MRNCIQQTDVESIWVTETRLSSSLPHFDRFPDPLPRSTMPRKAANSTAASGEPSAEPRRSSRIKEQPKEETAPKKTPKPRAKKVKEATDKEEKVKAPRGKKRKAEEEANGTADDEDEGPAEKKVGFFFLDVARRAFLRHSMLI